jgi:Cu-Zn family superoxide dismutase
MRIVPSLALMAAVALAGCSSVELPAPQAAATLTPAPNGGPTGKVSFTTANWGLDVHVEIAGLAPGSTHGFHVHDKGDCSSADFTSAGGHFNPEGHPHGPQDAPHHAGDMPNLVADAQGRVDQHIKLIGGTLEGAAGVVGHAVIVHAAADDYQTQPTGNSGARLACGVIVAK